MKSKLLIYFLPVLLVAFLLYGYSIQDDPKNDAAPVITETIYSTQTPQDTTPPAGFPYPTICNFNYGAITGPNGGTVGGIIFNNKYYLNSWNTLNRVWRYHVVNSCPGPGADSNAYPGQIRDMTVAPDGSGRQYLWGGRAAGVLYKMDSACNIVSQFTHTGAFYRAVTWDPNRKGFWSCNFADNIVCRDTNGTVIRTITNAFPAKYGMGFDSTSSADSAFLWVWEQGPGGTAATTAILHKLYLGTGTDVRTYTFNLPAAGVGIAGGAEVVTHDNKLLLILNWQNFAVTTYKLKDLTPQGGGSVTVCRTGIRRSIPENGGNGNPAIDTINISGVPSNMFINRMTVKIDSVIHTWVGDLRFWLNKVGATNNDTLISRLGWTGTGFGNACDNVIGCNLVDTAAQTVQYVTATTACGAGNNTPIVGYYRPKAPLQAFTNINPNGAYVLRISDNAGGDTGNLRNWCITIEYSPILGVNGNNNIVDGYKLNQNYPNPFNPATTISYAIPKAGNVTLRIYDILGKEVMLLVNEFKSPGNHEVQFNAANLSSGVYFYRLEVNGYIDMKKMMLLK